MIHDDDLYALVGFLHDELTGDEVEALIERLKGDEALAAQLLSIAEDEVRIIEWARLARQSGRQATAHRSSRRRSVPRELSRLVSLAAAVAIFATAGLAIQFLSSQTATSFRSLPASMLVDHSKSASPMVDVDSGVARIEQQTPNCQFFVENRLRSAEHAVEHVDAGDTLRLLTGELDLVFKHGTRVSLRAPAVFEVNNDMHTRMHRGSIRVDVAKGAEGFEVLTPVTRVIDLGTQFGINVDEEGRTDVAVFEGAVDLEGGFDKAADAPIMRRLVAGEAVQLDRRGTLSRIVMISGGHFPVPSGEAGRRQSSSDSFVITEVWDNIKRDESFKFYEIVHAGMAEDSKAFVDRIYHEWNGVDVEGMPSYLLGGDYVKTFNDDKMNPSLKISVNISRPATLYLLLDNRVPVPSWLPKDFEDTGDDLGIDEGFVDGGVRLFDQYAAVGPGVSIDNTFSIWKREIGEPSVVRLGAIEEPAPGPNPSWINMYGIVAVPLGP